MCACMYVCVCLGGNFDQSCMHACFFPTASMYACMHACMHDVHICMFVCICLGESRSCMHAASKNLSQFVCQCAHDQNTNLIMCEAHTNAHIRTRTLIPRSCYLSTMLRTVSDFEMNEQYEQICGVCPQLRAPHQCCPALPVFIEWPCVFYVYKYIHTYIHTCIYTASCQSANLS
jgi:hypothetical protein